MDYTLKGAPRLRRDTDANWKAVNPVLADGEQIAVKMTDGSIRYKIGNGSSDYNSLKYFVDQNYIDSKETICDMNSKKPISFSVGGIDGDNFVVEITGGGDSTSFVESFNGRSGDVVPQSGDYTANDVGAIATDEKGRANGVATLDSAGKVPIDQIPSPGANEITIVLSAGGWQNGSQTVQNAALVASGYGYIVTPAPDSYGVYAASMVYADAVTVDGEITFHCEDAPTDALTVSIMKIKVEV